MPRRNMNEDIQEENGIEVEQENTEDIPGTGEGEVKPTSKKNKVSCTFEENGTVSLTIAGGTGVKNFDPAELPQAIKDKLLPFAVAKKLGSQGAAAGKEGKIAEEAMQKVWEGLKNGDWAVRAPAVKKIVIKENELTANLAAMSGEQKEAALAALKALNIELPV